jgi:(p)ppGpp synthase/HD superfamily hydrolase
MHQSVYDALRFAAKKHHKQERSSKGAAIPYFDHILDVVRILDMSRDEPLGAVNNTTLIVAALHDTLEDTNTTYDEIVGAFGKLVADDVQSLTLPPEINGKASPDVKFEHQANSILTMSTRAVLVKGADKLSNQTSLITAPPNWGKKAILGYSQHCVRLVTVARLELKTRLEPGHPALDAINRIYSQALTEHQAVVKHYG